MYINSPGITAGLQQEFMEFEWVMLAFVAIAVVPAFSFKLLEARRSTTI